MPAPSELARVETRDNGALLRSHRRSVMPRVGNNFRFFAEHLRSLAHEDMEVRGHRERITFDPSGVTAIITPWNAPLMLATWRIGPALASGNTVVYKPPEWAPLTASLLADITADAGLPPGVFNVVQGLGAEAGAPLSAHPGIRRLSFTGSVPTAGKIAAAAAPNIVPLSFELGGKSPLVVFDDADFDLAVSIAVDQFDNAGQVCLGAFRILIQDTLHDDFVAAVLEKARTLTQGDPRDEDTDVSAMVSRPHFERVSGFVERAIADGARVLLGGGPNTELGGLFFQPTILTDVSQDSEIVQEEVFGPVLTVQTFSTEEQAVELSNDTRFGLAATLVTGDPQRAERVSNALNAGTVWVNCFFVRDLGAPFGGSGQSGIGREGGTWSFDFYSDIKNTGLLTKRLEGRNPSWVKSSGPACWPTYPPSPCPKTSGVRSTTGMTPPWSPGYDNCAAKSSTPSTTTQSSCSIRTGPPPSNSSSPRTTAARVCSRPRNCPGDMSQRPYDFQGDPELAQLIASKGEQHGTWITAINDEHLPIYYATTNLWEFLGDGLPDKKWISIGVCQTADGEDNLRLGRALGDAITESDRKVLLIASGALSHTFWPLRQLRDHEAADPKHIFTPEAYQADLERLEWFAKGEHARVLETMPEFYTFKPEARFGHYLMMIGALGEGDCTATSRQYGEYENSIGTGQVHLWFDPPAEGFPRPRRTQLRPLTAEQPSLHDAGVPGS